jgi:hypothetical protein
VANELNIFDVSAETPTDAWAHGSAAAKAWLTGSLRTQDGLDFSGEFDAQFSARFNAEVLKGLGSLSGDLSGAAHAGIRLQAGMPLDLFETAGIIARLRLEASASVRASVTAAMSVGELRGLVTQALPAESRPYIDIVLDEIRIGATVWARASFAAMAISELIAAVDLFPKQGGPPGVTAYFHYGFGWGWGAGWGVITNVGFDLKRLLRRVAQQTELDLHAALEKFRTERTLTPTDPVNLATQLAEVLLPIVLDALVAWCEQQLDSDDEERASLGDSLAQALRTLLANAILPRILSFAGEKIIENIAQVPPESAHEIWGELAAAEVYLAAASDDPEQAIGAAAAVLIRIAALLPSNVGAPLRSGVRCAAAIVVFATDSENPGLRAVLSTAQWAGPPLTDPRRLKVLAGLVLADELATLLTDEGLIPEWMTPLFNSVEALVATFTSDGSAAALTTDQAVGILHSLLTGLDDMMTEEHLWEDLEATIGFPEMVRAIKAQTHVVIGLCESLKNGGEVDKHTTREAISVAIIMLIGQPLAQVISTVAERGLAQVPPALRALADVVDASDTPTSINADWDVLAKQVLGSSAGFPVAQLLRHAAGTAAEWGNIRLPAELKMLRSFLEIDLADEFANVGPVAAVSEFKKKLLPILGQHVIDVVITSHEFILRDNVNLFRDMAIGTVQHIRRTLELSAIISFRLVEETIALAERGVSELQQREVELERDAQRYSAEFLTAISRVTTHIRGLDAHVGAELTDWMVRECMGPAAAAQMPDAVRGVLRSIVTAAVNLSSGGILSQLGTALGSIADLIDASAEALRLTAASQEGSLVGIQPLLESLVAGDRLPSVVVPIGFDIPNPVLPFVLPSIHVELARVPIPAKTISSIVMTIVFGSTGLAPLIETLNTTATSLRVTKGALATIREAIAGSSAQQMRQNLQAARPGAQLEIDRLTPSPAAVSPSSGTIAFRIKGANRSFVDPAGAGLPQQAISRVQVNVNGQVVSVADIEWRETPVGLEGRLDYGMTDADRRMMLRPGPTAVVIVVADGTGVLSAQAAWHFVVESPPPIELKLIVVPIWFPIAAGLTTPVPQLEQQGPVVGGPHVRLEAVDLPVPLTTLKPVLRGRGERATRWVRTRPGVRVDEHVEPDLPAGYLYLERLTDRSAAWCTFDGRFGRIDWTARETCGWKAKIDGPVRTQCSAGDSIAIATARTILCFDAGCGDLLWSSLLKGRDQRLLDATRHFKVIAHAGHVTVSSPEDGELWSVRTAKGRVAARVCGDQLVLAEPDCVRVLKLAGGDEEWSAKVAGEVVVAGENLLVPGGNDTSLIYSLGRSTARKLETDVALARPRPLGIKIVDSTLVAIVTAESKVVLVDLAAAAEFDRKSSASSRLVEEAWLAGSFLMTTPPLAVTHLWGGVATPIPVATETLTGAVAVGPAQAIVRGTDRNVWLEFS